MKALAAALMITAWGVPAAAQEQQDAEAVPDPRGVAGQAGPSPDFEPPEVDAAVLAVGGLDEGKRRSRLRDESGFAFVLRGGPSIRDFFGLTAMGGDVDMDFGGQIKRTAVYGGIGMFAGRTLAGLEMLHPRGAFTMEGRVTDRFRLGGQLRIGLMSYRRATTHELDGSMAGGLEMLASYDLYRADEGHAALFVGARGGFDFVPTPIPELGLTLGIRLR